MAADLLVVFCRTSADFQKEARMCIMRRRAGLVHFIVKGSQGCPKPFVWKVLLRTEGLFDLSVQPWCLTSTSRTFKLFRQIFPNSTGFCQGTPGLELCLESSGEISRYWPNAPRPKPNDLPDPARPPQAQSLHSSDFENLVSGCSCRRVSARQGFAGFKGFKRFQSRL